MNTRLTILQWSIIAALRAQVDYKFKYNERRAARRLVRRGLLSFHNGVREFKVTVRGAKVMESSR